MLTPDTARLHPEVAHVNVLLADILIRTHESTMAEVWEAAMPLPDMCKALAQVRSKQDYL